MDSLRGAELERDREALASSNVLVSSAREIGVGLSCAPPESVQEEAFDRHSSTMHIDAVCSYATEMGTRRNDSNCKGIWTSLPQGRQSTSTQQLVVSQAQAARPSSIYSGAHDVVIVRALDTGC